MKKKIWMIFLILSMLNIYSIYAEEKDKREKEEVEVYQLRRYDKKEDKKNYTSYDYEELKTSFRETNKNIDIKKIEQEILRYEYQDAGNQKDNLSSKITELENKKSALESQLFQLNQLIIMDDNLPDGHPNKMTAEERQNAIQNSIKMQEGISTYGENLVDMRKKYILLDFKVVSDRINLSYNKDSLESFIKAEELNFNQKIIDIIKLHISREMKEEELGFLDTVLYAQNISYELGYSDIDSINNIQIKRQILKTDITALNREINLKLRELSILSGIDNISGIKVKKSFFNTKLKSTDATYYVEGYKKHAYEFQMIDKQLKAMDSSQRQLSGAEDGELDSNMMKARIKKLEIRKNAITDSVESGSLKLLAGYEKVVLNKDKHRINLTSSEREKNRSYIRYSLGHMSRIEYNQLAIKYMQLKKAEKLIDLEMLNLKLMLDAMAKGIVQK